MAGFLSIPAVASLCYLLSLVTVLIYIGIAIGSQDRLEGLSHWWYIRSFEAIANKRTAQGVV